MCSKLTIKTSGDINDVVLGYVNFKLIFIFFSVSILSINDTTMTLLPKTTIYYSGTNSFIEQKQSSISVELIYFWPIFTIHISLKYKTTGLLGKLREHHPEIG